MKKNNVLILVLINLFLPSIFILSMNFSIVGTNNNLTQFSTLRISGNWTSALKPNNDTQTEWDDGRSTPHYTWVDEDPDSPEYTWVVSQNLGDIEKFEFETINIGNNTITQVKAKITYFDVGIGHAYVDLYLDGYKGEKTLISNIGQAYEYTWSGLNATQDELDILRLKFRSAPVGIPPMYIKGCWLDAVEINVYYE